MATWQSSRTSAVAILLASTVFIQMLLLGADGPLLAVGAAVVNLIAALGVLITAQPDAGFWRRSWPVVLVMALLLCWIALPASPLPSSWVPGLSESRVLRIAPDLFGSGLSRLFGGAALLIAAACAGYRRGMMRSTSDWILVLGGADIVIGLAIRQFSPEHVWGFDKGINIARFTGTMLNANANGCLSGAMAIVALGRLQGLIREMPRSGASTRLSGHFVLCVWVLLAGLGSCAISGSRTSLALTLLAMIMLVARDRPLRRMVRGPRGIAFAGFAFIVIAAVILIFGNSTFDRMSFLRDDGMDRIAIWSHYMEVARGAPVFGYGPGSFTLVNLRSLGDPVQAWQLWYINSPHNELLSIAIEHGWIALAGIIAITLMMAASIIRFRRPDNGDSVPRATVAAVAVIVGCAMVDIALDVPAIITFATILWSLLWGRALRIGTDRHNSTGFNCHKSVNSGPTEPA
jgi:O-antigen ligase